jgi:multidrug resistance protein, MATE family
LPYLKFGIPSTLLVCFEWWAFELLAIFSGWLDESGTQLAAQVALLQMFSMSYMVPMGISFSTSALVGSSIAKK